MELNPKQVEMILTALGSNDSKVLQQCIAELYGKANIYKFTLPELTGAAFEMWLQEDTRRRAAFFDETVLSISLKYLIDQEATARKSIESQAFNDIQDAQNFLYKLALYNLLRDWLLCKAIVAEADLTVAQEMNFLMHSMMSSYYRPFKQDMLEAVKKLWTDYTGKFSELVKTPREVQSLEELIKRYTLILKLLVSKLNNNNDEYLKVKIPYLLNILAELQNKATILYQSKFATIDSATAQDLLKLESLTKLTAAERAVLLDKEVVLLPKNVKNPEVDVLLDIASDYNKLCYKQLSKFKDSMRDMTLEDLESTLKTLRHEAVKDSKAKSTLEEFAERQPDRAVRNEMILLLEAAIKNKVQEAHKDTYEKARLTPNSNASESSHSSKPRSP